MLAATFSSCKCRLLGPCHFKCFNQFVRSARFGRFERGVRSRKNLSRWKSGAEKGEFLQPYHADATAVRPHSDLWKGLGFTVLVGGVSFSTAAIIDYERSKKHMKRFWNDTMKIFQTTYDFNLEGKMWNRLSDGQKCVLVLLGINALIFGLWKISSLQPFMWRWFTNSFASKALCLPMVLSAFSHSNWLHLTMNMFVVYSFFGGTIDKFLGIDQFCALYLTAASVSSLTSLIHKSVIRSSIRALGASGAILAILVYTCVQVPDARLQIIFIPGFTFSAASGVVGLLLFDLGGLVLGYRLFDHAAHLGGTLFGIFYALYGEQLLWKDFGDRIITKYRQIFEKPK